MKRVFAAVFAYLVALLGFAEEGKPLRVLVIGNSFSVSGFADGVSSALHEGGGISARPRLREAFCVKSAPNVMIEGEMTFRAQMLDDFKPLLESHALAVVHPDLLTAGGRLGKKKIGDMAEDYGVQMNLHMAESPIAYMAAVHVAAATRNFMALELHSVDVPWWGDLVKPAFSYKGGFIKVPNKPGLGIDELNGRLIKRQACKDFSAPWTSTKEWDKEWSNDRRWS